MPNTILFIELCNTLEKIDKTTKRLEIQSILSTFLKDLIERDPNSLAAALFLCNASIYPEYLNTELNIGDFIIQTTVSETSGLSMSVLKKKLVESGDLSLIAMDNRVNQLFITKKQLTVVEVFSQLRDIASIKGKNSVNFKKNIMKSLISLCSPLEKKYMVRLFECKLRIGLALRTILISLSLAFDESNYDIIKEAYDKQSDFGYLAKNLLEHGVNKLQDVCAIVAGIPLKPMLAQPCKNLTKAFAKFENGPFLSEYKYDGERVQIHHFKNQTKVFSRNGEDITEKYPDIAEIDLCGYSYILDGEVVAFKDSKILPFQVLSTRKRKNDSSNGEVNEAFFVKQAKKEKVEDGVPREEAKKTDRDVTVCVFCFDILFFNEVELLNHSLKERKKILLESFKEVDQKFYFANSIVCKSIEDIETHFKSSIQENCEGLMLKSLESIYKPSLRTNSWVKLKSDYLDSLGDSLDLVVIGAFYGKGKRTGSFGGFLLGVYNDESDRYEACCKIGTGFSDDDLKRFYNEISPLITVDTSQITYNDRGVKPDVWIVPTFVWEVKSASLSLSPIYSAGSLEKGISLRFPRFVKERTDKKPTDATTSNQLMRIYNENKNVESEDEEDEFN